MKLNVEGQNWKTPFYFKVSKCLEMDISENSGTTHKSSILMGFSIINHPFLGYPYFFGNTQIKETMMKQHFCFRHTFSFDVDVSPLWLCWLSRCYRSLTRWRGIAHRIGNPPFVNHERNPWKKPVGKAKVVEVLLQKCVETTFENSTTSLDGWML